MFMCGPAFWQQFGEDTPPPGGFILYEGYTESPDEIPFPPTATGTAETARADLLATVSALAIEDFEIYSGFDDLNTVGRTLNGIAFTCTSASGQIYDFDDGLGRYNTTWGGANYANLVLVASDYEVTFNFSPAISIFGIYITDAGDYPTPVALQVRLTKSDTSTVTYTINFTTATINGGAIFWGFTDDADTYTAVTFTRPVDSVTEPDVLTDAIGFDDLFFAPASYLL